jgi:pimeloyl-ACP methyl ester carboxylesterase
MSLSSDLRHLVPGTAVVFVHGLWLTGVESLYLRKRIAADRGFHCASFTYRTTAGSMDGVVERLEKFVAGLDAERVHFVGHSLGGLVLYRYFEKQRDARHGRVVFLGAPVVRSRTAEAVGKLPVVRSLVGGMVGAELGNPCERQWRCGCELGLIAGTRPMGLGRFFARFDEDCDGTVAVSETKLPGHKAHVTLPVSHMGMLLSAEVAHEVGEFLANGSFMHRDVP